MIHDCGCYGDGSPWRESTRECAHPPKYRVIVRRLASDHAGRRITYAEALLAREAPLNSTFAVSTFVSGDR